MGKPHPVELRDRAVRLVEQGCTHTEAAQRLCVSIKRVNDMVRLKRETGSLVPEPQGNPGRGKLTGVQGWVERRIAAQPDLTIDELTAELASEHAVKVHRSSVARLLLRLGLLKTLIRRYRSSGLIRLYGEIHLSTEPTKRKNHRLDIGNSSNNVYNWGSARLR